MSTHLPPTIHTLTPKSIHTCLNHRCIAPYLIVLGGLWAYCVVLRIVWQHSSGNSRRFVFRSVSCRHHQWYHTQYIKIEFEITTQKQIRHESESASIIVAVLYVHMIVESPIQHCESICSFIVHNSHTVSTDYRSNSAHHSHSRHAHSTFS